MRKNRINISLRLLMITFPLLATALSANAQEDKGLQRIVFPKDATVIDVKAELGAKGDGVTDDTAALQKGIDLSSGIDARTTRALYLPNGVYRVTGTLVVKAPLGPWMYGESRDGVIIRLDNRVKGVNSVLRTHPREVPPTSADWFMRNLRNFTIDVGDNPDTDGIRYCATNSGILKNVRVIGKGKIGVNAGFIGQSGPNLIQDVVVEGFETGVNAAWIWGTTLSRVTIRNCRKQGVYVNATPVAIEDLTVENTPLPVFCDYPNDWTWWGGVTAIVGGKFSGGDPNGPAIKNRSVLYARNITTRGFKMAIEGVSADRNALQPVVAEYASQNPRALFESKKPLNLPIKREPALAWETNSSKWVCVNDYGAIPGDNQDDTQAFQKAIDAAAAAKKTVVYMRGIGGGDPNWFDINGEVRVHGSVRFVVALGFGRILAGNNGKFIVDDSSSPVVKFQNIDSFGGPPVVLENRSLKNTMAVESCGVKIVGDGGGDIFATDCPSGAELRKPGQKLWARHLNSEGNSDTGLVVNNGGDLWVMGAKFEGKGIRYATRNGGRTEIFGVFNYGPGIAKDDLRPMFDIVDASLGVYGLREIAFDVPTYNIKVREKRGSETRTLGVDKEGGWIGWALFRN